MFKNYFQTTEATSTGNLRSTSKVSDRSRRQGLLYSHLSRSLCVLTLCVFAEVNKHVEGVIQSAKFPAAQPPDPNQPSKIETEYWPCPPSLAAMGNSCSSSVVQC